MRRTGPFASWTAPSSQALSSASPSRRSPTSLDVSLLNGLHPLLDCFESLWLLLTEEVEAARILVGLAGPQDRLLILRGSAPALARAFDVGFVEGALWDEKLAGEGWTTSSAPVLHPATEVKLGSVCALGGQDVGQAHMLALVRITAAALRAEVRSRRFHTLGTHLTRPAPVGGVS